MRAVIAVTRILRLRDTISLDARDYSVFLDLRDPRFLKVSNELLRENSLPHRLRSFLSAGDTFIDVGANHGAFSIVASDLVGGRGLVVAIEPQPRLAKLVACSLAANRRSKFEVHQFACADEDGSSDFYVPTATSGSAGRFSSFSAVGSHDRIRVQLKRFDEAIEWQRFRGSCFIKLDVEGSELAFMRGAANMIRATRPHIMLEINPASLKAAAVSPSCLIGQLRELAYEKFVWPENALRHEPLEHLDVTRHQNIVVIPTH